MSVPLFAAAALLAGSVAANAAQVEFYLPYHVTEVTYEFSGFGEDADGQRHELFQTRTVTLETPIQRGLFFGIYTHILDFPMDRLEYQGFAPEGVDHFVYGSSDFRVEFGADGIPVDWRVEDFWRRGHDIFTPDSLYMSEYIYTGYEYLTEFGFDIEAYRGLEGYGTLTTIHRSDRPGEWQATGLPAPAPVPLPATALLLIGGLGAFGLIRREGRRAA